MDDIMQLFGIIAVFLAVFAYLIAGWLRARSKGQEDKMDRIKLEFKIITFVFLFVVVIFVRWDSTAQMVMIVGAVMVMVLLAVTGFLLMSSTDKE